jgi:hypothetical protein
MWTVEWVDGGGNRDLQHNCLESSTLADTYKLLQLEKDTAQRKAAADGSSLRKVKRRRLDRQPDEPSDSKQPAKEVNEDDQSHCDNPGNLATDEAPIQPDGLDSTSLRGEDSTTEPKIGQTTETTTDPNLSFYLLRTGTTSTSKVLIPLDSSASLTQSLRDRTVLEYPTIFVLPQPPDSLPEGFLLDKEYNKICKGEEEELQQALRSLPQQAKQDTGRSEAKDDVPSHADAQRILNMLKRDITR